MIRLPFAPAYPIETKRLLLRPLTAEDTVALLSYRSDEETCRYLPFPPQDAVEIDRRLREQWNRVTIDAEGQSITLGMVERSSGRLIGDVILFVHSVENASGEVGYVVHPDARRTGYASEAASAMLRLGFEEIGLHRIAGRLDSRNDASARVLERIGMTRDGLLRDDLWFTGEWSSTLIYSILDAEWAAAHS